MDEKILNKMRNSCSRREYCTKDIREKIETLFTKAGTPFTPSHVEEILETLKKENFLSDSRYAAAYARDKAALSGWGPVKIGMYLKSKGIDKEIIKEAIEAASSDERTLDKAEKTIAAKWKALEEDAQRELKTIRFALQRGYEYEQIRSIINSLKK